MKKNVDIVVNCSVICVAYFHDTIHNVLKRQMEYILMYFFLNKTPYQWCATFGFGSCTLVQRAIFAVGSQYDLIFALLLLLFEIKLIFAFWAYIWLYTVYGHILV